MQPHMVCSRSWRSSQPTGMSLNALLTLPSPRRSFIAMVRPVDSRRAASDDVDALDQRRWNDVHVRLAIAVDWHQPSALDEGERAVLAEPAQVEARLPSE